MIPRLVIEYPHRLYVRSNQEDARFHADGTSLQALLEGVTYNELVSVLGEPTFPETSEDGRTQFEWVTSVQMDGILQTETVTIYDWKT